MSLHRAIRLIDVIQDVVDKDQHSYIMLVIFDDESGYYEYEPHDIKQTIFHFENLDDIPVQFADWIAKTTKKEVKDV
jgi:hypothetical protein